MNQTDKTLLPEGRIWFVRAGTGNALAGVFVEQGIVSVSPGGYFGPLLPDESKAEIAKRMTAKWPDEKASTIQVWAANVKRFIEQMSIGDAVATYDSQKRLCHLGIIRDLRVTDAVSPAVRGELNPSLGYEPCFDYSHSVEWLYEVSRDDLSGPAWRGLVNPQTLFLLSESTSAELRGLCAPAQ